MKTLRIWYVIDAYIGPTAGTERQLLGLIKGQLEAGHDVRLLVLRHTDYTLSVSDFPCPIDLLGIRSLRSFSALRSSLEFRRRVRRDQPDVVHAFFNDCAILVPLLARRRLTRVFTSRRDMGYWYTPGRLLLLRFANRFVDGIICNSRAVAGMVASREHAPAHKLHVIYNGMVVPATSQPAGVVPPAHELPAGQVNICLVANLRPIKRVEDLIRAAAKLGKVPGCRIWIVGSTISSEYAGSLERLVMELGLVDDVRFLGGSKDAPLIMRQCDIGVLTSESEGFSNTLMEYMAEGLPVVCSDVGGNPELVDDGRNGFLYPCGDVQALSERLALLCSDASLRQRMAAAAREKCREFSPEQCLQQHLELYDPKRRV